MMKKRMIALFLLLAMCLSIAPLGTVAYAQETTVDQGTTVEKDENDYIGRLGNFTFFPDETLIDLFNFKGLSDEKGTLYAFLEDVHKALSKISDAPEFYDAQKKSFFVEWSNIGEDGEFKFPIKYVEPAEDTNKKFKSLNEALDYLGTNHPLFSADMKWKKVFPDKKTGNIEKIRYYYEPEVAKQTRQEIVDKTEKIITLLKEKRNSGKLTDEQIILIVCDYYTSVGYYDAASDHRFDAYGTFVDRRSVCQGQAAAISYVLDSIGIPCCIIGESNLLNHGWNVVSIGDSMYHICITSAGTSRFGEINHSYLMLSTWQYVRKRVGENRFDNYYEGPEKVYNNYFGGMIGGCVEITQDGERIDRAINKSYESAFWSEVGSAFVPYDRARCEGIVCQDKACEHEACQDALIFISKNGELCYWKGNTPVQVSKIEENSNGRVTLEQQYTVLERSEGKTVLPGEWKQDDSKKFHKICYDYNAEKYYYTTNDGVYQLTFHNNDGALTYDYEEIYRPELRSNESIYDFYIYGDELFFKVSTSFEGVDREGGRHLYNTLVEPNYKEVPMIHSERYIEDRFHHVIAVDRDYLKDCSSYSLEYMIPYYHDYGAVGDTDLVWYGEYRGTFEEPSEEDDKYYYFIVKEHRDSMNANKPAVGYKAAPVTVTIHATGKDNEKWQTKATELNSNRMDVSIGHTLNLADDISINYLVHKDELAEYDPESIHLYCEIPLYQGGNANPKENEKMVGSKTLRLEPVLKGNYYYFVVDGISAVQMGDVVRSVLFATKDGRVFCSAEDTYNVATYAINQLNKTYMPLELKQLCAELLRYGGQAQTYKRYRNDTSLVNKKLTEKDQALLIPLEKVEFNKQYALTNVPDEPAATWAGKGLVLDSKVVLRYVFDAPGYTADAAKNLTMRVTYTDIQGVEQTVTVTDCKVYGTTKGRYDFDFAGLRSAEWRCVLSATIYDGETPVSATMQYSVDSYGNGRVGDLLTLCRAMIAFSDRAKEFFLSL